MEPEIFKTAKHEITKVWEPLEGLIEKQAILVDKKQV
jgi:hypothetical protein